MSQQNTHTTTITETDEYKIYFYFSPGESSHFFMRFLHSRQKKLPFEPPKRRTLCFKSIRTYTAHLDGHFSCFVMSLACRVCTIISLGLSQLQVGCSLWVEDGKEPSGKCRRRTNGQQKLRCRLVEENDESGSSRGIRGCRHNSGWRESLQWWAQMDWGSSLFPFSPLADRKIDRLQQRIKPYEH